MPAIAIVISGVALALVGGVVGAGLWAIATQRPEDGQPFLLREAPAGLGERITPVSFRRARRRLRRPGHLRSVRSPARRR